MAVSFASKAMLQASAQQCGNQALVTVVVAITGPFAVTGEEAAEVPISSVPCTVAE